MPQVAGTTDTYDLRGRRDSYLDMIYNISPEETPLVSAIGRDGDVSDIRHNWLTDALRAPGVNAQIDGDDYVYTDRAQPTVVSNITQIMTEPFIISGTAEAVRKWGRKSEIAYQKAKVAKVLKLDLEFNVMGVNQASVLGASAVARRSGSISSWLTSNVSRGATGANGGFNAGTSLTVAATDGTQRAFNETQLKDVMQSAFSNGGMPTLAYMAPAQKRVFSTFAGIAALRKDVPATGMAKITGAADVYVSDFGNLTAMPARQLRARDVLLIDPDMLSIGYLRPFKSEELAKTGDADKFNMIVEWTLVVKNQASQAIIADLS